MSGENHRNSGKREGVSKYEKERKKKKIEKNYEEERGVSLWYRTKEVLSCTLERFRTSYLLLLPVGVSRLSKRKCRFYETPSCSILSTLRAFREIQFASLLLTCFPITGEIENKIENVPFVPPWKLLFFRLKEEEEEEEEEKGGVRREKKINPPRGFRGRSDSKEHFCPWTTKGRGKFFSSLSLSLSLY